MKRVPGINFPGSEEENIAQGDSVECAFSLILLCY